MLTHSLALFLEHALFKDVYIYIYFFVNIADVEQVNKLYCTKK